MGIGRIVKAFGRRLAAPLGPLVAPVGRRLAGTITQVDTDEPVAALTFDDGPDPTYTPELLDILERHGARATFFMVGERAARHPSLVAEVAERGHDVANHSWNHRPFTLLSSRERREQLRTCQQALGPHGKKICRPPVGDQNLGTRLDLLMLGYTVVMWNVVGHDWQDDDAETIAARLVDTIQPGSIVLLHDALYTYLDDQFLPRDATLEAVDLVLSRMATYDFVAVSELVTRGRPRHENWYKKVDRHFLSRLTRADDVIRADESCADASTHSFTE